MEATTLTPAVAKLVADARAAGFNETRFGNAINLFKGRNPHNHGYPNRGVRVYLTENGGFYEAHRIDVRLDLALKIPTIKMAREILGL